MGNGDDASAGDAPPGIRVFLLDDHEVMRRGLARLLSAQPDIEVAGEAETTASALSQIAALRPDVAILDVRLPDADGVTACREIRSLLPETSCLMFTAHTDDQALLGAIMAGAAGYLTKQAPPEEMIRAIRTVAAGRSMLDSSAAEHVMQRLRERISVVDPLSVLTDQEKRVLELIGTGLTNRQIAERMNLADKTVKNYVASLLSKLGLERRSQAAVIAARQPNHGAALVAAGGVSS